MSRDTSNLTSKIQWAKPSAPPPWLRPHGRRTRAQVAGIRFENSVAKELCGFTHGPWYTYGPELHWCQPDLVFVSPTEVVVVEVKLTDCPRAVEQLRDLYIPVLQRAYGLPVRGIIVAKYLAPDTNKALLTTSFHSALEMARAGALPLLHWGKPQASGPRVKRSKNHKSRGLARPI